MSVTFDEEEGVWCYSGRDLMFLDAEPETVHVGPEYDVWVCHRHGPLSEEHALGDDEFRTCELCRRRMDFGRWPPPRLERVRLVNPARQEPSNPKRVGLRERGET